MRITAHETRKTRRTHKESRTQRKKCEKYFLCVLGVLCVGAAVTQTITRRKDYLSVLDLDPTDLERCLQLAAQLKTDRALGRLAPTADALNGRHVALLFDKPSLR